MHHVNIIFSAPRGRLLALGLLAALTGCGARYANFTPTVAVAPRAGRAPEQVALLFQPEEPTCKYRVVGLYEAGRKIPMTINGSAAPETAPLRADAAVRGFDGVKDIECNIQSGACSGKAFVCES